jgi:hypothetical protein
MHTAVCKPNLTQDILCLQDIEWQNLLITLRLKYAPKAEQIEAAHYDPLI